MMVVFGGFLSRFMRDQGAWDNGLLSPAKTYKVSIIKGQFFIISRLTVKRN